MQFRPLAPISKLAATSFRRVIKLPTRPVLALSCLLIVAGLAAPVPPAQAQIKETESQVELPAKQDAPVFIFDQAGGFRRAPAERPTFQLFADGHVVANVNRGAVEFQLGVGPAREFLEWVLNDQQLAQLTTESLEQEMARRGKLLKEQIADAPTATFQIDLPNQKHAVEIYALFMAKRDYPELASVQRLAAIESRVSHLVARQQLGDRAEEVLEFCNQEIKRQGLGIEPLKIEELRSAANMGDGRFQVTFERNLPLDEAGRLNTLNLVYFKKDAQTEPVFRAYGLQRE